MIIRRNRYLQKLISSQGNGLVKVVTGGRRCGKSFLLFRLFHDYLTETGILEDHIIEMSFDDRRNIKYRNPDVLLDYVDEKVKDKSKYYILLDEIQLVDHFVEVMLSLMRNDQFELYVTGSNSKFLSKDIATEFRGRGQEIRVWPLSFSEYYAAVEGDRRVAWNDYYTFGGLPQVLLMETEEKKIEYLRTIYDLTYISDIIDRNALRNPEGLKQLVEVISSGIGSPTNPTRIANTFKSGEKIVIKESTIRNYLTYLEDAFMIEEARRYDVKGRKYIGTENKYYFSDMGLRAISLNFRQQEETHIMENIIYNELRCRGYLVDVGVVEKWEKYDNGMRKRKNFEIDFVINKGAERIYIQSAYQMPTQEKVAQEQNSLLNVGDNFKKLIIVWDDIKMKVDDNGIITVGLLDFLTGMYEL